MSDYKTHGVWKNEQREKDTHPQFKAGKPIQHEGKEYWLSVFVNVDDPVLAEKVGRMIDALAEANGTRPILSVSLKEVEPRGQSGSNAGRPDDSW